MKPLSKNQKKIFPVLLGALAGVFGVLTALFVAKPLGSGLYGKVQYYVSVINTLSLVLSVGLPFFLIKAVQVAENKKELLGRCLVLFDIVSTCVLPVYFLIAYFLLSTLGKDVSLIFLIFGSAFFLSLSSILAAYFLGDKRLSIYQLISSFLPKTLLFAIAFTAVKLVSQDTFVRLYVPVYLVVYAISSLPFLVKNIRFVKPIFTKKEIGMLFVFALSSLTTSVISYLAKIIQGDFYKNFELLGVFSFSSQILTAGVIFCSIITKLSQPYFAALEKSDAKTNISYFRRILRWNSNFAIPFCVALAVEASKVLYLFGGESYSAYPLVMTLSACAVLIEVLVGPIDAFFSMGGNEKLLLFNGIGKLAVLSVCCWALSYFTDYGVPIAYLISAVAVSAAGLIEIRIKYHLPGIDWKTAIWLLFEIAISWGLFVSLSRVTSGTLWVIFNVLFGIFLIGSFFIFSPFADDRKGLPFLEKFYSKLATLKEKLFSKNPFGIVNASKKVRVFNLIYVITFFAFFLNVICLGNDKFFYIDIKGFELNLRMGLAFLLLIEFCISLAVNKNFKIFFSPYLISFIFMGIIAVYSFLIGSFSNGISKALVDIKSMVFLILALPFFDLFGLHLLSPKKLFKVGLIATTIVALFLLGFHFYLQFKNISQWSINKYFSTHFGAGTGFGFRDYYAVYFSSLFYSVLFSAAVLYLILFQPNKLKSFVFYGIVFAINVAAIFQSQTRGFELALALSIFGLILARYIVYFRHCHNLGTKALTKYFWISSISLTLVFAGALIFVWQKGYLNRLFSGDTSSDDVRLDYLGEVLPKVFQSPILFGKGLGYVIESANIWHIETSLLEILLKQGFVGLVATCIPFVLMARSPVRKIDPQMYFVSLLFFLNLYFTSLFNPYLSNIVGMMILLVVLPSLNQVSSAVSAPRYVCWRLHA